jgi:hypothetical protein
VFHHSSDGEHHFRDATDGAANQNIGHDRQSHRGNQHFQLVDATVDDELINHVHNRGEKEDLSDIFPSLPKEFAAMDLDATGPPRRKVAAPDGRLPGPVSFGPHAAGSTPNSAGPGIVGRYEE